jgi:hypothetical protein
VALERIQGGGIAIGHGASRLGEAGMEGAQVDAAQGIHGALVAFFRDRATAFLFIDLVTVV